MGCTQAKIPSQQTIAGDSSILLSLPATQYNNSPDVLTIDVGDTISSPYGRGAVLNIREDGILVIKSIDWVLANKSVPIFYIMRDAPPHTPVVNLIQKKSKEILPPPLPPSEQCQPNEDLSLEIPTSLLQQSVCTHDIPDSTLGAPSVTEDSSKLNGVVHAMYMNKLSSDPKKGWRRRYFVLRQDGTFAYYDSFEVFDRNGKPKVSFNIKKLQKPSRSKSKSKSKLAVVHIPPTRVAVTYHGEKAELDCDSQEDAEQLVRVINELTDQS